MIIRTLIIALLVVSPVLAAAPPPAKAPLSLAPADEGVKDKSFALYRSKMQSAIKAKNVKALVKLLDPKIKLNFGGGTGIAAFKSSWKPNDPTSQIWNVLNLVVNHGGHFNSPTQFAAPYVYSAWPNDIDAFNYAAMTTTDVELRDAPHESRKTVRKLGYEIVEVLQGAGKPQHEVRDDEWSEVKTGDGKRGFVPSKYYRSSIDYRAVFEKQNGKWRMTVLVAGD